MPMKEWMFQKGQAKQAKSKSFLILCRYIDFQWGASQKWVHPLQTKHNISHRYAFHFYIVVRSRYSQVDNHGWPSQGPRHLLIHPRNPSRNSLIQKFHVNQLFSPRKIFRITPLLCCPDHVDYLSSNQVDGISQHINEDRNISEFPYILNQPIVPYNLISVV